MILSSTKASSLKYLLKSNVQKDQLIILWKTKRRKKTKKKTKTKLSPSVLQYLRQTQQQQQHSTHNIYFIIPVWRYIYFPNGLMGHKIQTKITRLTNLKLNF